MVFDLIQLRSVIRRHSSVVAYVVMGVAVSVLLATFLTPLLDRTTLVENIGDRDATSTAAYTLEEARPARLRVPALNIDVPFTSPLGLNEAREVEVPKGYNEVGWYKYGPTPGELGPAVVFGHVDSIDGPAVFFYLGQLKPGDTIEVERQDDSVAVFEVTALERYDQDEFPTELVYGNINHAGLRLVTCSGTFDKGAQRYSHNLVVYAALQEPAHTSDNTATTTP